MCLRQSHVLATLTDVASDPKSRETIWNNYLEVSFHELKCMVSAENLLNYNYWKIPFNLHTGASDKQLGAVISQNYKPIDLFSRNLRKPQYNYSTIEKDLLSIV